METIQLTLDSPETVQCNALAFSELNELQLALVGGGSADVILA